MYKLPNIVINTQNVIPQTSTTTTTTSTTTKSTITSTSTTSITAGSTPTITSSTTGTSVCNAILLYNVESLIYSIVERINNLTQH